MKSIRLSLMVYFLGLLGVALFVASLLVYQTAERTLKAKRQATADLIEAQYGERCRAEDVRLNQALLSQAQSLAGLVQVQFERNRSDLIQPALMLGVLSSSLSPNGYLLTPTWLAEGALPPRRSDPSRRFESSRRLEQASAVYLEFRSHLPPAITKQVKLDELLLPSDGQVTDYYQIDSPSSKSYHSHSLGDRSFPLDDSVFRLDQVVQWVFDDTMLDPDTPVRRVVLKASGVPYTRPRFAPRVPRESPAPPPRVPRDYPPSPPSVHRGPTIYIHCAAETSKRDAALAALAQQREDDLAAVTAQTRESLHDLRNRFLTISVVVFVAVGIGSFWLVRLGLSPLQRLSDAVSRVSAKDFRLPLDQCPLPLELQPLAQRLNNTLDLLKRAFAREKQAAADISHELRTPLAALLTTAEFALRKPRSPEQYRELIGDCHTSAQHMNQIVERLLTLARLDAGVDRLRVQAVDAAALAQQCATVVRPLAEARGLKLTVERPSVPSETSNGAEACLVKIDSDKLREVVTNLLHNAIQYNQPGGAVDLRVARENGSLEVEVRDTGIGIGQEARQQIFERFYRADPSRGSDEPHAGLGLAIVKEYIDLMGGSIGVESVEGQGSTFRVLLPVH